MNMAAVVAVTVIHIEFADQLIPVGVGIADAKVSRHTGTGGRGRSHRRPPIRGKDSGDLNNNRKRQGIADISLAF